MITAIVRRTYPDFLAHIDVDDGEMLTISVELPCGSVMRNIRISASGEVKVCDQPVQNSQVLGGFEATLRPGFVDGQKYKVRQPQVKTNLRRWHRRRRSRGSRRRVLLQGVA